MNRPSADGILSIARVKLVWQNSFLWRIEHMAAVCVRFGFWNATN